MIVALIVIGIILFLFILNYAYFKRSVIATIVEFVLWIAPSKREYKKMNAKNLVQKPSEGKVPKLNCKVERFEFDDMPVYVLSSKKKESNKLILFIHGGAYIKPARVFHWRFCAKLARKLGAKVVVPIYPLAPNDNWKNSHEKITQLYLRLQETLNCEIILMGDSAGGGMAASLCMSFAKQNIVLPDKTILLSPWVDVTMSNPNICKFEKKDPMLAHEGLIEIGKVWADNISTKDYRVSPKYGICVGVKNMYVFVGTREILFPDIVEFYMKFKMKNIKLYVREGMNHDYPLFPIPEACIAFKQISDIIMDKNS